MPLPARIALWRRRVVAVSLAVFAAAWIAVAALGRQAVSPAPGGQTSTAASTQTQTSAGDLSSATTRQS